MVRDTGRVGGRGTGSNSLHCLSVTVSVRGGVARSSEAARGSGHGVRDNSPPQLLSRKYCGALRKVTASCLLGKAYGLGPA